GDTWLPLHSHVSREDGAFLQRAIEATRATRTLEVGMAYGVSTLFICEALAQISAEARHVALDPFQHADWRGIGLANVKRAGFESIVEFHEKRSELALPAFLAEERVFDVVLIDGWHSFDQALVEFYYVNRMLRSGGIVLFDDANWPGISKLMRLIVTLPNYEVFAGGRSQGRPRLPGTLRRRFTAAPWARTLLNPSFRQKSWDLGICHRLVAFRKTRTDDRPMNWFEDF